MPDGETAGTGMRRRTILGLLAGLPGAVGLHALLRGESGAAPAPARPGVGPSTRIAATPGVSIVSDRLRKLAPHALPQGFDASQVTQEDMVRIMDLLGRGVPLHHRRTIQGVAVAEPVADPEFPPCPPYASFSDGKDTDVNGCTPMEAPFGCVGGALDDFECTANFICHTFDCEYSFDMSDCEGTFDCLAYFEVDGGFGCPNDFQMCPGGYSQGEIYP